MNPTRLAADLERIEETLHAQQQRRAQLRAALRVLQAQGRGTATTRVTAALIEILKAGPRTVAGCHAALMERKLRLGKSRDVQIQRTHVRTLLHRNPVLFAREKDGRWALRDSCPNT
jgi:hypothetical protein